jgi:hypothetical protein
LRTHLAVEHHLAASTQTQALNAVVFLDRAVLKMDRGDLAAVRAVRRRRVPSSSASSLLFGVFSVSRGGSPGYLLREPGKKCLLPGWN